MSRLYDALSKATVEKYQPSTAQESLPVRKLILPSRISVEPLSASSATCEAVAGCDAERGELLKPENGERSQPEAVDWLSTAQRIAIKTAPLGRLVAWNEPNSLGAEKFRALVTRLDHIRKNTKLSSLQIISSVANEGKSLVAANLAVTLAKHFGAKTLLIDGDLHGPTLAPLFGLGEMSGVSHWWKEGSQELGPYLRKFDGVPLWFIAGGRACECPSELLRSPRFATAFASLTQGFDWIIVDSTPMLPVIDANLWSRLVDGTLLVAREGVAPLKALKDGLHALDHPNLVGVVLNEASDSDQVNYYQQHYLQGREKSKLRYGPFSSIVAAISKIKSKKAPQGR